MLQLKTNLERANEEAPAWKEILTSAVKVDQEGAFSKYLQNRDEQASR